MKLAWHPHADRQTDYVAFDERMRGGVVGYISVEEVEPTKFLWYWEMTARGANITPPEERWGYCRSARAACEMAEAAWFAAIAGQPDDAQFG